MVQENLRQLQLHAALLRNDSAMMLGPTKPRTSRRATTYNFFCTFGKVTAVHDICCMYLFLIATVHCRRFRCALVLYIFRSFDPSAVPFSEFSQWSIFAAGSRLYRCLMWSLLVCWLIGFLLSSSGPAARVASVCMYSIGSMIIRKVTITCSCSYSYLTGLLAGRQLRLVCALGGHSCGYEDPRVQIPLRMAPVCMYAT